jgi:hypothetical protein
VSDRQGSCSFARVLRCDAFREAVPVRDGRVASRALVAADIKDEPVPASAEDRVLSAEVAWPAEGIQVLGADTESHPCWWMRPVDLLDYGVYLRANRGEHLQQFLVTGGRLTELLDHVHGRANLLMAHDLRDHAPRVVTEHSGADSLTRQEPQALGLKTLHDPAIIANSPLLLNTPFRRAGLPRRAHMPTSEGRAGEPLRDLSRREVRRRPGPRDTPTLPGRIERSVEIPGRLVRRYVG